MKVINCHTLTEMCEAVLDGEPVFIIRAQDKLAITAVAHYLDRAQDIEAKNLGRVTDVFDKIVAWQKANPKRVKVPD